MNTSYDVITKAQHILTNARRYNAYAIKTASNILERYNKHQSLTQKQLKLVNDLKPDRYPKLDACCLWLLTHIPTIEQSINDNGIDHFCKCDVIDDIKATHSILNIENDYPYCNEDQLLMLVIQIGYNHICNNITGPYIYQDGDAISITECRKYWLTYKAPEPQPLESPITYNTKTLEISNDMGNGLSDLLDDM